MNINKITNEEDLKELLKQHRINYHSWDIPGSTTKTVNDLFNELKEEEARLVSRDGKLIRLITVVSADVYYERVFLKYIHIVPKYLLTEEIQTFSDGRSKKRETDYSVAEKMFPGENPCDALYRMMKEELGISDKNKNYSYSKLKTRYKESKSSSYPGLITEKEIYYFVVSLTNRSYNPSGYIEEQEDKKTYFVWKKCK